ncbi:hypothetical protein DPMN_056359 [Dreissena polymorpha]|uniref:Uncharacterized protein n=1 Tax=Dreissena polymorpha TaxID=45954 RepID=A0A9D4HTJ3_DREPO|nr:hypothetical protein DPMN_056359 [Dreissena polymorpha]
MVINPNTPTPNSGHASRRSQSAPPHPSKAHPRKHPPVSPRTPLNTQPAVLSIQRPWDTSSTEDIVIPRSIPQPLDPGRTSADSNHTHKASGGEEPSFNLKANTIKLGTLNVSGIKKS